MTDLNRKIVVGLLRLFAGLAALLFLPAWTADYWQAWIFLAIFSAATTAITVYVMQTDPALLARRMHAGPGAEKERTQKFIQFAVAIASIVAIVLPAIDHRLGWSTMSAHVVVAGDVLVALGYLVVFFVFRENTFASSTIEVAPGQKVISTGPYALVRHPMYTGGLVMFFGAPLALGSWWGLLAILPITLLIVWRLLDEETFLVENLPGYTHYRQTVRYRLVPFVW